jgi:peptidoglycan/LPS O-acetylase OafA/YrhL
MERSATGRLPSPAILLANFLMLPTMVPVEIMIVHAWSLSYELLFYLTLPLLIRYLRMSAWPGVFRSAFWSGLAALSLALTYLGRNPHPRFVAFLCGILLFELVRPSARPNVLGNTLALIAFCGALSIRGFNSSQTTIFGHNVVRIHSSALYSLLFLGTLLLGYFLLASQGFLQRALSWTPLRYFGNMSYSYYLVHGPVLFALNLALARLGFPQHLGAASFLFLSLASFALTLLPAAALFLLVEKPLSLAPRLPSPPGQ